MFDTGDGLSLMLDGKRKSTRAHQRPLEYWRNEHKVFGRDHKSKHCHNMLNNYLGTVYLTVITVFECCSRSANGCPRGDQDSEPMLASDGQGQQAEEAGQDQVLIHDNMFPVKPSVL